jgi:hypothetical protein
VEGEGVPELGQKGGCAKYQCCRKGVVPSTIVAPSLPVPVNSHEDGVPARQPKYSKYKAKKQGDQKPQGIEHVLQLALHLCAGIGVGVTGMVTGKASRELCGQNLYRCLYTHSLPFRGPRGGHGSTFGEVDHRGEFHFYRSLPIWLIFQVRCHAAKYSSRTEMNSGGEGIQCLPLLL